MVQEISVDELSAKIAAGFEQIVLVDVREPGEYRIAALAGSVLIPLRELQHRADEIRVRADGQVVVYCHHGVRSLSGAAILERLGFPNVVSLAGGIDAWSARIDPKIPRY